MARSPKAKVKRTTTGYCVYFYVSGIQERGFGFEKDVVVKWFKNERNKITASIGSAAYYRAAQSRLSRTRMKAQDFADKLNGMIQKG